MPVRAIAPGSVVVWVRGAGSSDDLAACLERIPAEALPVVTSGAHDGAGFGREVVVQPGGNPLATAAPADVVLLDAHCDVPQGWLGRLRDAARADSLIATARPLSGAQLDAPASILDSTLSLRPRVDPPTADTGCVYIRRSALALVGAAEQGLFERCTLAGLVHVLAGDLVVGPGEPVAPDSEPVARALSAARRAVHALSLVIDARLASGHSAGTRVHIAQLVRALAGSGRARVRVVADGAARAALPAIDGVEVIGESEAIASPGDVVHRPLQVFGGWELVSLQRMAERVIVTHHDLIGYRNPSYFASPADWEEHRRVTRSALALADHVVFVSAHAREDALAEDLVEPGRASVVHNGVDHVVAGAVRAPAAPAPAAPAAPAPADPAAPAALAALPAETELIVCLGADYRHKNRVFALRVAEQLTGAHGWNGRLVFAGAHVGTGSSAADEAELLARVPSLRECVVDLGPVSDGERMWLLQRAGLVLYPSVYEGFGLVPFEAARAGVPCMWAAGTALSELLGDEPAPIAAWDPDAVALHALRLLRDPDARGPNVARIEAAAAALTWDAAAGELIALYGRTCDAPRSRASAYERDQTGQALSEDALRLLGRGGALPAELERPLLALATHPAVGRPVLGVIRLGYELAMRARRRT